MGESAKGGAGGQVALGAGLYLGWGNALEWKGMGAVQIRVK